MRRVTQEKFYLSGLKRMFDAISCDACQSRDSLAVKCELHLQQFDKMSDWKRQ